MATVHEEHRTKDWVFTMNNPDPLEMENLHSLKSKISYLVYQLEISDTGTEHLQGYVEFVEGMTWSEVKEIFGETTYFRRRRGIRQSAREYCTKKESRIRGPWEIGTWEEVREGDLEKQCEYILSGKKKKYRNRRCKNFVNDGNYCRTHKKIIEKKKS